MVAVLSLTAMLKRVAMPAVKRSTVVES
jgi:hypothetical protein